MPEKLPAPSFEDKCCSPTGLEQRITSLPRPLVFTNGVFDILHRGHVTYLAQARALGASLVLALNSDVSARRLGKGDDRPINNLENRMAVVAALESVSLVTWFDEDTPRETILRCHPDVLVKGGDWDTAAIAGATEVRAWGGRVLSIAFEHALSTTSLVTRIRSNESGH